MKYYKHPTTGEVYAYEADGSQDAFILPELVQMTDEEVQAHLNPPVPPETPEQIVARLERALDAYIDNQAHAYRYESIRTMVTYENDPNPKFNAEGKGAKAFRSACYTLSIQIVEEVQQGLRPIPTEDELIALMPTLASFIVYA